MAFEMEKISEAVPEVNEHLSKCFEKLPDTIKRYIKLSSNKCVCQRPYNNIICINCGHVMFGRVKYKCPKHSMVTFLIDITNCPKCRCFHFMLSEFDINDNK